MIRLDATYGTRNGKSCSDSAVIFSADENFKGNRSGFIQAEDLDGGRLLRCDVFINAIQRLEILTTVRKITVDEREVLQIQGFDIQNNVFSSLEGLPFVWNVSPDNHSAAVVISIVPFRSTNVEVSATRRALEDSGSFSDWLLVQGVQAGRGLISARLADPNLSGVPPATVPMSVVHLLELLPFTPVYLAPLCDLQYALFTIRNDVRSLIQMPSTSYKWSVDNVTVATVDPNTGLLLALAPGQTFAVVKDQSVEDNEARGLVTVATPSYVRVLVTAALASNQDFSAIPPAQSAGGPSSSSRNLIRGRLYDVTILTYDSLHHPFLNAANLRYELEVGEGLAIVEANPSKSKCRVRVTAAGTSQLIGRLIRIENTRINKKYELETPLVARQEVYMHEPIFVTPPTVVLPKLPTVVHPAHSFQLVAHLGSGQYEWMSRNPAVATVDSTGVVTAVSIGETEVTAVDRLNTFNNDTATVIVSDPLTLSFLPGPVEVQIASAMVVAVRVQDRAHRHFHNCSALPFRWTQSDSAFFRIDARQEAAPDLSGRENACAGVSVLGVTPGRANLLVSISDPSASLAASQPLAVYGPLQLVDPAVSPLLLALATQATLTFSGGPAPWLPDGSSYLTRLKPTDGLAVSVTSLSPATDGPRFRVTCLKYGSQELEVLVTNTPTLSNPFPASVTAVTFYACAEPAIIRLSLSNLADSCYSNAAAEEAGTGTAPHFTLIDRKSRISVAMFDAASRPFYNSSSVLIQWRTGNRDIVSYLEERLDHSKESLGRLVSIGRTPGAAEVSADAIGYTDWAKVQPSVSVEEVMSKLSVTGKMMVRAISPVALEPPEALLYFHPDNVLQVHSSGGSGHYSWTLNDPSIANMSKSLSSVELQPRRVGYIILTVRDGALPPSCPGTTSTITISEAAAVRIQVREKLHQGHTASLVVQILDARVQAFPVSQYRWMSLSQSFDQSLISLTVAPSDPNDLVQRYNVSGLSPGVTTVVFRVTSPSHAVIQNEPRQLEVYSPLRIEPRLVALMPGAQTLVDITGGPQIGASVSLWLGNTTVCRAITSAGYALRAERVGETVLHAKSEGVESITGETVLYSQDSVPVVVSLVQVLTIHAPTSRIYVHEEIPVYVVGSAGDTPFTFPLAHMAFEWSVFAPHVLSIAPVSSQLAAARGGYVREGEFSVRVGGKSPGSAVVAVRVIFSNPGYDPYEVEARSTILVVERLALLSSPTLLLATGTFDHIRTNKDGVSSPTYEVLDAASGITVDSTGRIIAGDTPTKAAVRVTDDLGESLLVLVTVRLISVIQLVPQPPLYAELAVGTTGSVAIVFRDDLGRVLGGAWDRPPMLSYRLSTVDVATVVQNLNQTLTLRAQSEGSAVLQVAVRASGTLESYLKVSVTNMIIPSAVSVLIGGTLQFSIRGVDILAGAVRVLSLKQVASRAPDDAFSVALVSGLARFLNVSEAALRLTHLQNYSVLEIRLKTPEALKLAEELERAVISRKGLLLALGILDVIKGDPAEYLPAISKPVWAAVDPSVIRVDDISGKAVALSPGVTEIPYNGTVSAATTARVVRVGAVELYPEFQSMTNVPEPKTGTAPRYIVGVKVLDESGDLLASTPGQLDHRIRCRCSVVESNVVDAVCQPAPPGRAYTHVCQLVPLLPVNQPLSLVRSVTLAVSVSDDLESSSAEHRLSLPYSSAFYLPPQFSQVLLSPTRRDVTVEVVSDSDSLSAHSSDPYRVSVVRFLAPEKPGTVLFSVRLLREPLPKGNVLVEIFDHATGQRAPIDVRIESSAEVAGHGDKSAPSSARSGLRSLDWLYSAASGSTMALLCSAFVILATTICLGLKWRGTANRPGQASPPVTPFRSQPGPSGSGSRRLQDSFHHDEKSQFRPSPSRTRSTREPSS